MNTRAEDNEVIREQAREIAHQIRKVAQLEAELAESRREKHSWATKAGELRRDYEMAWKRGDDAKRELNDERAATRAAEKEESAAYREADRYKAALGRAVAILPDALKWIEAETVQLADAVPYEECIAAIKSILADPDGKAAGEYVAALENAVKHAREIRRLQKRGLLSPVTEEAFDDAIAAVDARRGQMKCAVCKRREAKLRCRTCGPVCDGCSEEWQCRGCGRCVGELSAVDARKVKP